MKLGRFLRRMPARGAPVIAQAVPLIIVQPEIPRHLRQQAMQAVFHALFKVHIDGSASVKTVKSSGNSELDALALQAARQWRFHPATRNGQFVESYLRLQIEFKVA